MPNRTRSIARLVSVIGFIAGVCPASAANLTAEDFFKSTDVTLYVAADAGGGYDAYARAIAPYLQKNLPGHRPVIVKNMPGAGGVLMANYMAHQVAADGSAIGLTLSTVVLNQLTQPQLVHYDASKFGWLGTIVSQTNVLAVSTAYATVRSIDDAKTSEIIIGATNANSFLFQEPKLMNELLHTKFKLVTGYKGVADLDLALERGEIGGHVSPWSTLKSDHAEWLKSGAVVSIIRTGGPADDLKGVPYFINLVQEPKDKELVGLLDMDSTLGRSLMSPPGIPADRLELLRKALAAAVQDPAFLADADREQLPVGYLSGESLEAYVVKALQTSPATVKSFLDLMTTH